MKILINKHNPNIRITAPEIDVHEEEQMYLIPSGDYCIPMCIDDWTIVEEESKHTEVWVEGRTIFEQEGEPIEDLEKEAVAFCFDNGINITPYQATRIARHFYELGRNARKGK